MFIKILILIIVVGVLYKFLRSHGCGTSCQRSLRAVDPSTICHCACATCPCSPLQAFDFIPKTLEDYYNKGKNRIRELQIQNAPRRPIESRIGETRSEQYSSITLTSPLVIEESHRASHHNFEPPFSTLEADRGRRESTPSTSKIEEPARIPAVCKKCKSLGMTCMRSCPRAKNNVNTSSNTE
ncbi:uncharacterized protein LOC133515732 [Cydia pomonella]|uniref:uncharacterized protein LOC133515732 n=1 Tax=Cydia pomonella TaxID=82600 RepID=UPI002ADE6CCF|nr:uncharacterized protein LOC133515732 [Cydia pomonella]